jgi:hypothetical protein
MRLQNSQCNRALKTDTGPRSRLNAGSVSYSKPSGAVASVFGKEVDFATETKQFAKPAYFLPQQLIRCYRRPRIGNPDLTLATTAHAERTNLSMRTFNRRFTRCTLGYSKKLENLKHAVALFCWHFNFVRKHSAHGKTPAVEAGLAERALTIAE